MQFFFGNRALSKTFLGIFDDDERCGLHKFFVPIWISTRYKITVGSKHLNHHDIYPIFFTHLSILK